MSKTPKTTTTVNRTELPAELKPYLMDYLSAAGELGSNPFKAYQGKRFAAPNQFAQQAANTVGGLLANQYSGVSQVGAPTVRPTPKPGIDLSGKSSAKSFGWNPGGGNYDDGIRGGDDKDDKDDRDPWGSWDEVTGGGGSGSGGGGSNPYVDGLNGVNRPKKPKSSPKPINSDNSNDDDDKDGQAIADLTNDFVNNPVLWNRDNDPNKSWLKPLLAGATEPPPAADYGTLGASAGNPVLSGNKLNHMHDNAIRQTQNTLNGQYLYNNPHLNGVVNDVAGDIATKYAEGTAANTSAAAAMSGNFGGSAHQLLQQRQGKALADSIGQASRGIRYGDYSRERQNQVNAVGQSNALTGTLMGADTQALNNRIRAGQAQLNMGNYLQGQNQRGLDFNYQQWQAAQNQPYRNIQHVSNAAAVAQGQASRSTTAPNPNYRSPLQSILGFGASVLPFFL